MGLGQNLTAANTGLSGITLGKMLDEQRKTNLLLERIAKALEDGQSSAPMGREPPSPPRRGGYGR